ncbi:MAG: glycosyltransferase family 2 protein [Anaerolineae bacterium]
MSARISVVIPNYNGRAVLPDCLAALRAQSLPPYEVIVVDDASTDGSAEWLRAAYPEVSVLARPKNGGFCVAANAGLRAARGDLLALLNNDTVADQHWLRELALALEAHPEIAFCACKLLFHDRPDHINSAGLFLRADGVGRDRGFGQLDGPAFATPREVFGASGGAAVYQRTLLEAVGLLDEDLGAYGEDLDLSFRARLQGHRCLYVPTAVVRHRLGATYGVESPTKVRLSSRNMLLVLLKNMPGALLLRHAPRMLAVQVYQVLYFFRRGRGGAVLLGKLQVLAALGPTLRKRRQIQRARRLTTAELDALLEGDVDARLS